MTKRHGLREDLRYALRADAVQRAPTVPGGLFMSAPMESEILCAVTPDTAIAVVRVRGKGSMQNAPALKQFADRLQGDGSSHRFIIDLQFCDALDSTFLGVLAAIALAQRKAGNGATTVINANDYCRRILNTMGLVHILELRDGPAKEQATVDAAASELVRAVATPTGRVDQICLLLQAHRDLSELGEDNKVQFQSVIECLEKSLAAEKNGGSENQMKKSST